MATLRIVGRVDGQPSEFDGKYIVDYEPELHDPDGNYDGGVIDVRDNRSDADVFATMEESAEMWKRGPSCECHRTRADGQPNRPLTAFTVEIER